MIARSKGAGCAATPTGPEAVKATSLTVPHNPAAGSTASAFVFADHRQAALALLNSSARLTRKAGSFLGQLVVDPTPMTPSQAEWLGILLGRAGLPAMGEGGTDG